MAYMNFTAINAARRKAKAAKAATATDPVVTGPLSVPPVAPIMLEAPAVIDAPVLHQIAKCRWCKKAFRRHNDVQWICQSSTCADRQLAAAMRKAGDETGPILFLPLPLQIEVDESPVTHLLIAGAAGVSKSTGARWNLYRRCRQVAGYRALLLRTSYPELERNHLQFCVTETRALGDAEYKAQPRIVKFRHEEDGNDALIYAGYCDVAADIPRHLGAEWNSVEFDEAVTFLPQALTDITTRARGTSTARLTLERLGLPAGRTRLWSNPGGRAMRHLVSHYIRRNPDPELYPTYRPEDYGYINCTLEDNPFLPPEYAQKALSGLSAARYEQLRFGRWDIYAGQFFETFDSAVHLTEAEPA